MRLWHPALIPVLPRQQLLGQWRELNSIFKLQNRHVLINFVYEEEDFELQIYSSKVVKEMWKRGYKIDLTNFEKHFGVKSTREEIICWLCMFDCYNKKMTDRYLRKCYYNLQEKYDCGAITDEEWEKIENVVKEKIKNDNL